VQIPCYTLPEVLAEKIRAVAGQRRFAVSRDLYDIHWLLQSDVAVEEVLPLLPAKFEARGVDMAALSVRQMTARRVEFEADWTRRLNYLVRDAQAVDFEAAWQTTVGVLRQLEEQSL